MGVVSWDDFENLSRRYPQIVSGKIRWAVGGGAGVSILLDAQEVEKRKFRNDDIHDRRAHKDIEMVLFEPILGEKNPNRHDVFGIDNDSDLQSVDYGDHSAPEYGIWVEALRGYYMGFTPPTKCDVTMAILNENRYVTLSPEYLIASKLFSANGQRDIDTSDALLLMERLEVRKDTIRRILNESLFKAYVPKDGLEELEKGLENGSLFKSIRQRVQEKYSASVLLPLENIDYSSLITMIRWKPEELKNASVKFEMGRANGLYPGLIRLGYEQDLRARLCLMYLNIPPNQRDVPEEIKEDIERMVKRGIEEIAFACSAFSAEVLKTLDMISTKIGDRDLYETYASTVLRKIFFTDYHFVMGDKYRTGLERIYNGLGDRRDEKEKREVRECIRKELG